MPHTLRAAAKAVGRDRTTIVRAIRSGRLSATKDAATGDWLIEPAELHRLYPPLDAAGGVTGGDARLRTPDPPGETEREVRARLADAHATIEDLRRRLDAEAEERRRLTAVLADQRTPLAPARRSWWRWRRT